MKKIAYIELDTHAEIAQNFVELMQDSDEFQVEYYFSERIIKQTGRVGAKVYLSEPKTLLDQLSKEKYALVIIGTVHRYFSLFHQVSRTFNTAIVVHNLNFIRLSRRRLFSAVFKDDFIYRIKLAVKEGLFSAPKIVKETKKLLVLDEALARQKFRFLPLFYCKEFEIQKESVFTIVIPGSVQQARRDYRMVIDTLKSFKTVKPFKVVFLGKASGKELSWLQQFDSGKPSNLEIQYFTSKVPQSQFDRIMQSTDVLWCPVQRTTEFFSNKEIYGETKMSGNIGDAIKYGKLAIFPENYKSTLAFVLAQNENPEKQLFSVDKISGFDFQKYYHRKIVQSELEKVLKTLL